jgi:hypothetical protein
VDEPLTRAEVDRLIREAIAADRQNFKREFKHQFKRMLGDSWNSFAQARRLISSAS